MVLQIRPIRAVIIALALFGILLPAIYTHWLETGSIAGLGMSFQITLLVYIGLGLTLFFITLHIQTTRIKHPAEAAIPKSTYENQGIRRRVTLAVQIYCIPSFGLLYSTVLGTVLMPSLLIFMHAWGLDHRSTGIEVHLIRPATKFDFSIRPLVVHVDSAGVGLSAHLYLNEKSVDPECLGALLTNELKNRANWSVYVESSSNTSWEDVIGAIDIVRAVGAKPILLTTEIPSDERRP